MSRLLYSTQPGDSEPYRPEGDAWICYKLATDVARFLDKYDITGSEYVAKSEAYSLKYGWGKYLASPTLGVDNQLVLNSPPHDLLTLSDLHVPPPKTLWSWFFGPDGKSISTPIPPLALEIPRGFGTFSEPGEHEITSESVELLANSK